VQANFITPIIKSMSVGYISRKNACNN